MKDNFNQFIDALAKASGQYALCEAVKKGYKICCEGRNYYLDMHVKEKPTDGPVDEFTVQYPFKDKHAFAKYLHDDKIPGHVLNKEPFKFGKSRIANAYKDDDVEYSVIETPIYVDDEEIIPDSGKHKDSIANIRRIIDYAARLARDKYGLSLTVYYDEDWNKRIDGSVYIDGAPTNTLVGFSNSKAQEDKFDNLAKDLQQIGFEYIPPSRVIFGEKIHRYKYVGRYSY